MLALLRHRLREWSLRRAHRLLRRKVRVLEALGLPEDLERAAVARALRRFEERLDRFTRHP